MDLTTPNSISVFDNLRRRMLLPETWVYKEAKDSKHWSVQVFHSLRLHWPEYLMEAGELGIFMIAACTFAVLIFHPSSPVSQAIENEAVKRMLMGVAMGSTAIAIIFSPIGKRSGAHFNPSVTLTYFRLGKVAAWDAVFYIAFQFLGAIAGVLVASLLWGNLVAHQSVNYSATLPGPSGPTRAFLAELLISFILMSVILNVSNTKRLSRWTGVFAGALVATYISIESPISGMSMNPARTFGSAAVGHIWHALWIYFSAPPLGMLLAAELYRRLQAGRTVACAKLNHYGKARCIFHCDFQAQR
ncbi:MAG TPA: aquaporin [Pyrinomonadaceae bacterium]|jgi:aquaporin Z|nr:aquaporin [Pyrinomonadaceae bacterium]